MKALGKVGNVVEATSGNLNIPLIAHNRLPDLPNIVAKEETNVSQQIQKRQLFPKSDFGCFPLMI
jgi:hypothetical protein